MKKDIKTPTESLSFESVKIKKEIVDLVRANKLLTGVPVGKFFELSAEKELNKSKIQK